MIFISHSTQDDEFVTRLHSTLTRRGYATWVDHMAIIPPGRRWDEFLEEVLQNCNVMILVLSNAALNSNIVGAEWREFFREKKLIIPVKIEVCLAPLLLRHLQILNFIDSSDRNQKLEILISAIPASEQDRTTTVNTYPYYALNDDVDERKEKVEGLKYKVIEADSHFQKILDTDEIVFLFDPFDPDGNFLRVPLKPMLTVGLADDKSKPDISLGKFQAQKYGVSRLHFMLRWSGHGVEIIDLGSTNGTYVDGIRLSPEKDAPLLNKSILQLGEFTMIVLMKEYVNL